MMPVDTMSVGGLLEPSWNQAGTSLKLDLKVYTQNSTPCSEGPTIVEIAMYG